MNTSRLIWGIVCLVLAAGLAVLNVVLPPEDLMFMVGSTNMPALPPIILGIAGIVLLATSGESKAESQDEATNFEIDPEKEALNKRLEGVAWGCFLILLGGFVFVPEQIVEGGWWSIGVGSIMLGLNAARYLNQLKMSGFTTFLGIVAIIDGTLQLLWMDTFNGSVFLIILGAYLVIKPWIEKQGLFGKAEAV